jgi:hypothetical protein
LVTEQLYFYKKPNGGKNGRGFFGFYRFLFWYSIFTRYTGLLEIAVFEKGEQRFFEH